MGNIRNTVSTHAVLNAGGTASSYTVTDNFWFRYDSMNRLVTDKGSLSGTAGASTTTIVRGTSNAYGSGAVGQDYVYDAAGQKVAAIRTDYTPGSYDSSLNIYNPGTYQETRENYDYDGAGRVADIRITQGWSSSETVTYNPYTYTYTYTITAPDWIPPASATGGTNRSVFTYDLMGRQTAQTDYDTNGTTVIYSRSASYAANGFLQSDYTVTKKYEANYTTNLYTSSNAYSATATGTNEYLLGAVGSVSTYSYKNSYQNTNTASTTNTYQWWDSALQGTIAYKPNTSQSTTFNTYFAYTGQGTLTSVSVNDGRPRTASYITNGDGQIIRRDEQDGTYYNTSTGLGGDPHEVWYRFGGKELGYVGNNGATSGMTETASISDRQAWQDTGGGVNLKRNTAE